MNRRPLAFTLIELLVAVSILAVLTAAVGLNFIGPFRQLNQRNEIDALRQFDADARTAAITRGQTEQLIFDVANKTVSRFDGIEVRQASALLHLPSLRNIRVASTTSNDGLVTLDISAKGLSRSYRVAVGGHFLWTGLSGQTVLEEHERTELSTEE